MVVWLFSLLFLFISSLHFTFDVFLITVEGCVHWLSTYISY